MRHRTPAARRWTHRRWTPRAIAGLVAAVLAAVLGIGVAWAYWTAQGSGNAAANVATFNPPTNVTASTTTGTGTVGLSWSAASLSTGGAPTGYYVSRITNSSSASAPACGSSPSAPIAGTSCNDTGVADGTYHYSVTAIYHSWTAVSGSSNSVTVVNIRPDVTVNQAAGQADPTNTLPINFTATFSENVVDFTASAVTVGGTAAGSPTVQVTGSGSSYTIAVSGLTGSGTVTASIAANTVHDGNGAGNTASTSTDNTVSYDPVAPSVAAPQLTAAVTFGTNPIYVKAEPLTFTAVASDAGSGVKSVSYYSCPTATGSCSAGSGTLLGSSSTAAGNFSVTSSALSASGPYQIIAVALDNAGNTSTSASTLLAVDTTPPTASRPTVNGHS
jgi:hypothetical protein